MSGDRITFPLRLPAKPHDRHEDAVWAAPWFHKAAAGAPAIVTLTGNGFVDAFKAGVAGSGAGFNPRAWPELIPYRDWSEPPDGMLDDAGAPVYPTSITRRVPDLAEIDGRTSTNDAPSLETTITETDKGHWLRKLYLPFHTHHHFVTAELVCGDARGKPRVDRKRIKEAGFVIRRLKASSRTEGTLSEDEVWEDWIPSPDGRTGVWAKLDEADGDPSAIPEPPIDEATVIRARLGLPDSTTPLTLASTKLNPLPPSLGESDRHSGYFGWLGVQSKEVEAPMPRAEDLKAAIAARARTAKASVEALTGLDIASEVEDKWSSLYNFIRDNYDDVEHLDFDELYTINGMIEGYQEDIISYWNDVNNNRSSNELYYNRLLKDKNGIREKIIIILHIRAARFRLRKLLPVLPKPDAHHIIQTWTETPEDTFEATIWTPTPLGAEISAFEFAQSAPDWTLSKIDFSSDTFSHKNDYYIHILAEELEFLFSEYINRLSDTGSAAGYELDLLEKETINAIAAAEFEGATLPGKPSHKARRFGIDLGATLDRGIFIFPRTSPKTDGIAIYSRMINFYDIVEKYNNDTNEIISYTANHDPNLLSHIMTLEDRDTSRLTPPRFDTNHIYAVRCWSRLHGPDPRCPMPKVVWSARSEPFTIAEPMDPLGLKPHAMQLPDIPKLIRALPRIPKAKALPFAAVSIPKDSNVSVTDDAKDTMRQWGAAWICTYGIPVFTICAWVAFSVILSILLMIPGFAWMLFLKFCVPVPVPAKAT